MGKEGECMWEIGSYAELQHSQFLWIPVLGESPRGQRAGWERSAAVRRKVASSGLCPTVFTRADSILFYIKRVASKMLVFAINISTWKKTSGPEFCTAGTVWDSV